MTDKINKIEINIEGDEAKSPNIVVVDYFTSPVKEKPHVLDIICRFRHPVNGKEYEIKQRELKEAIQNHPQLIESNVTETVQQFCKIQTS